MEVRLATGGALKKINTLYERALKAQDKGNYQLAIVSLKELLQDNPGHFAAWHLLGMALFYLNQLPQSRDALLHALSACPDYYPARLSLAEVYGALGQTTEANTELDRVLQEQPPLNTPYLLQIKLAEQQSNYLKLKSGLHGYIQRTSPKPMDYQLHEQLVLPQILESLDHERNILEQFDQALTTSQVYPKQKGLPQTLSTAAFQLAYFDTPLLPRLQNLSRLYHHIYPDLESPYDVKIHRQGERIRIGVISSHLDHQHAVAYCFSPILKNLDRDQFDIIYFKAPQEVSRPELPLRETLGKVRRIPLGWDIKDSQKVIAQEKVDLLWYTDCQLSNFSYLLAHSRLAPRQCTSPGHPTTTGISTMDAFIASASMVQQKDFTEHLATLPTLPVAYQDFKLEDSLWKADRSFFGLSPNHRYYFCPQTLFKIHPKMDTIFLNILRADPKAIILFSYGESPLRHPLEARLHKSCGKEAHRLHFINSVSQGYFLPLLKCVNVLLDTTPFGGGNTTLQAFSLGIPVVSLTTSELRGSTAQTLYDLVDLPNFTAQTVDTYVEQAINIAQNQDYYETISQKMRTNKYKIFQQEESVVAAYQTLLGTLCQ